MNTNTDDWQTTVDKFWDLFRDHVTPPAVWPEGVKGKNFMTPEFLGVVYDAERNPVEITTGWFLDHRLFGMTWPRNPDGSPSGKDRCVNTLDEVATFLSATADERSIADDLSFGSDGTAAEWAEFLRDVP